MRLMIASRNRLVGLGLVTLGEAAGLIAETVSLEGIRHVMRGADLMLIYSDIIDADLEELLAALRAAHTRFIVVLRGLRYEEHRALLGTGALFVFSHDETDDLSLALANYRWSGEEKDVPVVFANGFRVDLNRHRLYRGDRFLDLTMTECQFLATLIEQAQHQPGQPLSLPEINLAVWGFADARTPTTVRGYVSQLRAKIEVEPDRPSVLLSHRGRGYWLVMA